MFPCSHVLTVCTEWTLRAQRSRGLPRFLRERLRSAGGKGENDVAIPMRRTNSRPCAQFFHHVFGTLSPSQFAHTRTSCSVPKRTYFSSATIDTSALWILLITWLREKVSVKEAFQHGVQSVDTSSTDVCVFSQKILSHQHYLQFVNLLTGNE